MTAGGFASLFLTVFKSISDVPGVAREDCLFVRDRLPDYPETVLTCTENTFIQFSRLVSEKQFVEDNSAIRIVQNTEEFLAYVIFQCRRRAIIYTKGGCADTGER